MVPLSLSPCMLPCQQQCGGQLVHPGLATKLVEIATCPMIYINVQIIVNRGIYAFCCSPAPTECLWKMQQCVLRIFLLPFTGFSLSCHGAIIYLRILVTDFIQTHVNHIRQWSEGRQSKLGSRQLFQTGLYIYI